MRKTPVALCCLLVLGSWAPAADFPDWAYAVNPPGGAAAPDDGSLHHVPDSAAGYTRAQLSAIAGPVADWHPEEHPPMPGIVARGRPPAVYACGYCHLPNGAGRPENASVAGLPAAYIRQQILAFRAGERPGAEPKRAPQTAMIAIAKAMTGPEIDAAAEYFSAVKPESFVTVTEAATVPKTIVAGWMLAKDPRGGTEPIGQRIVELAEDVSRFENRDTRTTYVAYVPPGSLARGAALVTTGAGRTQVCATCHGPDLHGLADVPRLAGRSPSFLLRQLYDLRHGGRMGATVELMKPVVANLTDADLIDIVAYLASRRA